MSILQLILLTEFQHEQQKFNSFLNQGTTGRQEGTREVMQILL